MLQAIDQLSQGLEERLASGSAFAGHEVPPGEPLHDLAEELAQWADQLIGEGSTLPAGSPAHLITERTLEALDHLWQALELLQASVGPLEPHVGEEARAHLEQARSLCSCP